MKLEVCVHCFCPPGLDFYAQCLKWQWASLLNNPVDCVVDYHVCYTEGDTITKRQIERCMQDKPNNIYFRPVKLEPEQLFRRAIGRNIRALATDADIVWFSDIDYLFGKNCLNETSRLVKSQDKLCMPKSYHINTTHEIGDLMLENARDLPYPQIPKHLFSPKRASVAIGGMQIVGGDFAKEVGYLEGTKHVAPVDPAAGFRSCKCDRWYRSHHQLKAKKLPIPNLFRIRHILDGRDFFANGIKGIGKEAW